MGKLKTIFLNLLATVNIVVIVLMLLSGYSDHFSPEKYPLLACAGMFFPFTVIANLLFVPIWVLLSWKRLLISIAGFLLAFPPIRIYMPLHARVEVPDDALCVVSYNVCGYGGNFKYDAGMDTIFNYLKARGADIVCTQEDNESKFHNMWQRYTEFYAYNDTTNVSESNVIKNCVGIHSRFPILRKEVIPYDAPSNGSVAYFLQVGADTVLVINNHLEQSHLNNKDRSRYEEMLESNLARNVIENEKTRDTVTAETRDLMGKLTQGMKIRARHVEIIHQYIEEHRQYPIISCGDFNDTPISYAHHVMAKGLTDCFVESGRGLGLSFNRKGFNLRIDHMMCSSHFTPLQCEIDDKMDASDHYPLLCWLKMKEKT